jgi:hypothetical protein
MGVMDKIKGAAKGMQKVGKKASKATMSAIERRQVAKKTHFSRKPYEQAYRKESEKQMAKLGKLEARKKYAAKFESMKKGKVIGKQIGGYTIGLNPDFFGGKSAFGLEPMYKSGKKKPKKAKKKGKKRKPRRTGKQQTRYVIIKGSAYPVAGSMQMKKHKKRKRRR